MGLMLDLDAQSYVTCVTLIVQVRGDALATNRCNSLPCKLRTFRQRSFNQRVGCLLCSMARIYDIWDWSVNQCVGQDLVVDNILSI